jgi:general secretion pathway protein H
MQTSSLPTINLARALQPAYSPRPGAIKTNFVLTHRFSATKKPRINLTHRLADTAKHRVNPRPRPHTDQGFTLIEVLVVVGLMALMATLFFPSLTGAFRAGAESQLRKLALTMGQARDRAMLANKLIRLNVDFEKQTLNLEEADSGHMIEKESEKSLSEREKEELAKKEANTWIQSESLMPKTVELPKTLKLIQISSPRYKKPLTEGQGRVYFFNDGHTDGATIFFETDEKTHFAIVLHPITGLSKIEPISPEDNK